MRIIFCCTIFVFIAFKSRCQPTRIDSLIQLLNNKEIKPDGNYFGPTYFIANGPATELMQIGKPATVRLVSVVTDTTKGVIAHLILTEIWKDTLLAVPPIQIDREGIIIFTVNQLHFFIKGKDVYANASELESAYYLWKASVDGASR